MVLSDMGRGYSQLSSVAEYEAAFREWYAGLLLKTGSHDQALAAYHRGLRGRFRKDAKAYAQRCLNLATAYAKERP